MSLPWLPLSAPARCGPRPRARRRLREEFSVLWVVGASGALGLSIWDYGRTHLAALLGTTEEGALLATASLFLAGICLDMSTKVSRLANQQKHLVQELSLIHI